jgi:hypothetical protein
MRFESRELKPYGEPVLPEELKIGETYFAVLFLDDHGFIPALEPKVYIGRDLEPGDEGKFYFQDNLSYRRGIRFTRQLRPMNLFLRRAQRNTSMSTNAPWTHS